MATWSAILTLSIAFYATSAHGLSGVYNVPTKPGVTYKVTIDFKTATEAIMEFSVPEMDGNKLVETFVQYINSGDCVKFQVYRNADRSDQKPVYISKGLKISDTTLSVTYRETEPFLMF